MKEDKVYLNHIIKSILKIETYTIRGKAEFMESELIQDAVIRNLQIIGEATKKISRDLSWGIDVPLEGCEGKKIYVWIEAVWGYFTASKRWCEQNDIDWNTYWKGEIPFHLSGGSIWPEYPQEAGLQYVPGAGSRLHRAN